MGVEMSVTRNLQSSALFSLPFIGYQPVNISNSEPAVSAANLTKQTILGPPFKWNYNRESFNFTTNADTQDYYLPLTDFGFLERVTLTDSKGVVKEIEITQSLSAESVQKRPGSIAPNMIDPSGGVTFRLNAIPPDGETYQINGLYQKAPVLMASMANTWGPIPDHMGYIYDWGFLSFVSLLTKDARFPIFGQRFTAHLLGAQEGLTALERNIFLGNFLQVMTAQERSQLTTQQGVTARQN
jgi:hypothetical protein